MYDILVWKGGNKVNRRGNMVSTEVYYLNDGSVHFPIRVYADGSAGWVEFLVDPGYKGVEEDGAITQEAVDGFYASDANPDYWDTSEYPYDLGQIIYNLDYGPQGVTIEEDDRDSDGEPDTWVIATKPAVPVTLFVKEYTYSERGKSGKFRRTAERVDLAEYSSLPFEIAVSLDPLTEYPAQNSPAPRKHDTLSTLWGKIKAK